MSSDGNAYISWRSGNGNVIDNSGNVCQSDVTQAVRLVADYSYGDYVKSHTYTVTVSPKKAESQEITLNDNRILRKITVKNVSELETAFSYATAGDAIIIKNGTYENCVLTLKASGTEKNPVFVIAENVGGAVFKGTTSLTFDGDFVVVAKLSFSNGAPSSDKGCMIFNGDDCRITNNRIEDFCDANERKWIYLSGKRNEVDHNFLSGKSSRGALLTVWRNDASAQYHHIHHNYFKNYAYGDGGNGFETIRIGDSSQLQSDAFCLVEYNLFEACNGEIETVSVKS